ncbi:MAG: hypothetical protein OEZ68_20460 [Gammaproteobacteria bacterium]|nr:hypothetical protein [Gammaproteobacteria bacterium]MDH5803178.1 hypothetical protein [Gammaproteobacteria bacterium]
MKLLHLPFVAILSLTIIDTVSANEVISGVVHFTNGETVNFTNIGCSKGRVKDASVFGDFKSKPVEIKLKFTQSLTFAKSPKHNRQFDITVVNSRNKEFVLNNAYILMKLNSCRVSETRSFVYTFYNDITDNYDDSSAEYSELKRIDFNNTNKKKKDSYPPGYKYDPYTGEKL